MAIITFFLSVLSGAGMTVTAQPLNSGAAVPASAQTFPSTSLRIFTSHMSSQIWQLFLKSADSRFFKILKFVYVFSMKLLSLFSPSYLRRLLSVIAPAWHNLLLFTLRIMHKALLSLVLLKTLMHSWLQADNLSVPFLLPCVQMSALPLARIIHLLTRCLNCLCCF